MGNSFWGNCTCFFAHRHNSYSNISCVNSSLVYLSPVFTTTTRISSFVAPFQVPFQNSLVRVLLDLVNVIHKWLVLN